MERIADYDLVKELGSGSTGTVFLARTPDGSEVALKLFHGAVRPGSPGQSQWVREARVDAQLAHPNLVRTIGLGVASTADGLRRYVVMELVRGQVLRTLVDAAEPLPEERCIRIALQLASALQSLHRAGVVHRDLKPENVIVAGRDHAVLMDLGLAWTQAQSHGRPAEGMGSPLYAAPEQLSGAPVDGRADLFALGVTLLELASGCHPWDGVPATRLPDVRRAWLPASVPQLIPDASERFSRIIARLLAHDPNDRYESAGDVIEAFESDEPAGRRTSASPVLVGRDSEIGALVERFRAAARGRGSAVVVHGEAGIGKTRLVEELVDRTQAEFPAATHLVTSHVPGTAVSSVSAFSDACRACLSDERIERALHRRLGEADPGARAFRALLRGDPPPTTGRPLGSESARALAVETILGLAEEAPTLVVIEDLHFAPSPTDPLFRRLTDACSGERILVVGTTRDAPPAPAQGHALVLPRLQAQDLRSLLRSELGCGDVADGLLRFVQSWSGGNPYFVREILLDLRSRGVLVRAPDRRYELRGVPRFEDLPPTLKELVEARLDSVPGSDREILDAAACSGFRFAPASVAHCLSEDSGTIRERLRELAGGPGLVVQEGTHFRFDHHVVLEVLRAAVPAPLAREYHSLLADQLIHELEAGVTDHAEIQRVGAPALCEHLLAAGRGAEMAAALPRALHALTHRFDHAAAASLVDRALAVPDAFRASERIDALLLAGRSLDALGDRRAERDHLDRALALARRTGDDERTMECLQRLSGHYCMVADWEPAELLATELEALAEPRDDRGRHAFALLLRAMIETGHWRHESALALIDRAGAMAGDTAGELLTLKLAFERGSALASLRRFAEAATCLERAHRLATDLGEARHEALALIALVRLRTGRGEILAAERLADAAASRARSIGDVRLEANVDWWRAILAYETGRFDDSERLHLRAARRFSACGDAQLAEACELGALRIGFARGDVGALLRGPTSRTGPGEVQPWLTESRELGRSDALRALGALEQVSAAGATSGPLEHASVAPSEWLIGTIYDAYTRGAFDEARAACAAWRDRHGSQAPCMDRIAIAIVDGSAAWRLGDRVAARELFAAAAALSDGPRIVRAQRLGEVYLALAGDRDVEATARLWMAERDRVTCLERIEGSFTLWEATGRAEFLADAEAAFEILRAHAPREQRAELPRQTWLYRALSEAIAAQHIS